MTLPSQCATFDPYFKLSDDKLHEIVAQFRKEMEGGLAEYGHDVAMVPSFVTGVPDGSEQGLVHLLNLPVCHSSQNFPRSGSRRYQSVSRASRCIPSLLILGVSAKSGCLERINSKSNNKSTRSLTSSKRARRGSYLVSRCPDTY